MMPSDPREYAHELYAVLHWFDGLGVETLFIEMPPDEPQWLAIRDRILRATRPFPPQAQ
jgi:L-threonylcarbamoyladenylate synthase